MNVIMFLGHHWLLVAIVIGIVVFLVLEPALAALGARWLVGTELGRHILEALAFLVLLALCWFLFAGHYRNEGAATQKAADAAVIAGKDKALLAAGNALRAAGDALTAQNEEADREVLRAKQAQVDADRAGTVALEAQDAAQRRMQSYDRDLQNARSHPTCAALLDADLLKACGL